MIDLAAVDFRYGTNQVLRDCSLRAGAGESVALFGANGAGKSTILRLCLALLHPAAGRVRVAGIDTAGLAPEDLAGAVGYLFQRPEDQLVRTTVLREVGYGPERLGWAPGRIEEAVRAVLERCGLADQADTHPYDLPLPKRRLVALASVLVMEPKVLLLDEPTALLDRHGRALVAEVVRERAAAGCTVLAVVHDPAFAIEALDRAVALAHQHGSALIEAEAREARARLRTASGDAEGPLEDARIAIMLFGRLGATRQQGAIERWLSELNLSS
ncbi:MAG TPA: ABC transporter ATP-binding protein [Gemmatimonadales bacterium]|nr:ABC transporter ATP-binding protein [Gemmatimonadales bacterium]